MKFVLNFLAVLLLLVNGIGALYGGWSLITDPSGGKLQLALHYLEHTPFQDYFIPGLVLFFANGACSLIVLCAILFNCRYAAKLIIAQGIILSGWIVIQILMIQVTYWLHWLLGGIGIALIIIGYLLLNLHAEGGKRNR